MSSVVHISARCEYAIRAMLELAAAEGALVKADLIAHTQAIPTQFLENILMDLRRKGLIDSRRGARGGHRLALPAAEISLAQIIDATEQARISDGDRPDEPRAAAAPHRAFLEAVRVSVQEMLEAATLAALLSACPSGESDGPA